MASRREYYKIIAKFLRSIFGDVPLGDVPLARVPALFGGGWSASQIVAVIIYQNRPAFRWNLTADDPGSSRSYGAAQRE